MSLPELVEVLPVHNELGEGVVWDSSQQALWWTDIESSRLYRYRFSGGGIEHWETPERLGSFALVAGEDYLIGAFASGFACFDPPNNKINWLSRVEQHLPGTRLNDGRADRQGRFWAGGMVEDREISGHSARSALYCIDSRLKLSRKLPGLLISNGLCWSPDSKYMYHTDTPSCRIDRYDFDAGPGTVSNRAPFAKTPAGISPDGSTVDADGCVWNAQWAGSRIVRYTADGKIDYRLQLPVSQPTCVTFGGPQLDLLFVTSAKQGMDGATLSRQPDAGNLFIYKTPFTGLPESCFKPETRHRLRAWQGPDDH